ncbi:MAG TPA: hypothetical protein VD862_00630 [Candidatus Paceibacterota bacterium]|nr:hypothetical protein [Candidatus Paceibacterota bacterium]
MMKVSGKPLNAHFWMAVAAIALAGGLILGQATGINDDMSEYSGVLGTANLYESERLEVRRLNMDLQDAEPEPLEGEFDEVDGELEAL